MFKSYYVVWKLTINPTYVTKNVEFKSYYVVWKQEFWINVSPNNVKFKSYYVVWKHKKPINKTTMEKSLNRTMQYGNLGHFLHSKPLMTV